MDDEILTIPEVAKLLKINEKTAYRLASQSEIPGFKVGGSWRFRADELRRWMETQAASGKNEGQT
ncbi:helix-turn-helix domain-containing protein [uncultured Tateyamaria sp.]|uniref:helix-turn-helix domain-containing protein n=1 Tax=Tateyamaria sp. 1078 TaxID=3417464 RepID=UPI00260E11C0|nr:helix-turn-helix domain-containing protein [uncultured Tateyamaria sp.]